MPPLLFKCEDAWNAQTLGDVLEAASEIGYRDLGLDIFPNEIVIVNEAGMRDAYTSSGLPHMYPHWSFGKEARALDKKAREGGGLAYELVIPTNPCKSWNMASNSAATMALVLAHAAVGHNHYFKNNYLFREHTNASGLNQYLMTVRDAVVEFEKRYGWSDVESIIDAAHALMIPGGFSMHGEPEAFDAEKEIRQVANFMRELEGSVDLETIVSVPGLQEKMRETVEIREKNIAFPESNILYFIETYAPKLKSWERQLIRMLRTIAQQCWLPMVQTKFMNEGFATFTHMYILRKMHEEGMLDDGTWLEILQMNQGVTFQWSMKEHGTISAVHNPYAMGSAMLRDIVRMCGPRDEVDAKFFEGHIDMAGPTDEDRRYFRSFAGSGDWRGVIRDAVHNFRDDTAIQQYLSPRYARDNGLFVIKDMDDHYLVTAVQDREGFTDVREAFAKAHSMRHQMPDIRVVDVDLDEDRELKLEYYPIDGMDLMEDDRSEVEIYLESLWGYTVNLEIGDDDE